MIDEQLVQGAVIIRKTFLRLKKELNTYQKDVSDMVNFLKEKIKIIEQIKKNELKNLKSRDEVSEVTRKIVSEIEQIEIEEKRLQSKIKKINVEMEKLSKDEGILYNTIKGRYPELTDEEIIRQIHQRLEN